VLSGQKYAVPKITSIPQDLDGQTPINLLEVGEGDSFYAEEATSGVGELTEMKIMGWFETEKFLIEIMFNLPTPFGTTASAVKFDQTILFDSRKTLLDLKRDGIGRVVGLKPDKFKLRRNLLSREYKSVGKTLTECGIFDGTAVFVEIGTPLRDGEFVLHFSVYDPHLAVWTNLSSTQPPPLEAISSSSASASATPTPASSETPEGQAGDGGKAETEQNPEFSRPLFECVAPHDMKVADLRPLIIQKLAELKNMNIDPRLLTPVHSQSAALDVKLRREREIATAVSRLPPINNDICFRLRDKMARRYAGRILLSSRPLQDYLPTNLDSHHLAIQFLVEPDLKVADDQAVVWLQEWHPDTWTMQTSRTELVLPKEIELQELASTIYSWLESQSKKGSHIPLQNLAVRKAPPAYYSLQTPVDLLMFGVSFQVREGRLYLNDGDTLLFCDRTVPPHIPPHVLAAQPKEKGLSISTEQEDMDAAMALSLAAQTDPILTPEQEATLFVQPGASLHAAPLASSSAPGAPIRAGEGVSFAPDDVAPLYVTSTATGVPVVVSLHPDEATHHDVSPEEAMRMDQEAASSLRVLDAYHHSSKVHRML
jgi:hypothetical protein